MLLPSVMTMFLHDWELLRRTLPVIVRADHSEKPTILAVMNKLLESILTKYEYAQLHFQVRPPHTAPGLVTPGGCGPIAGA